MTSSPTKVVPLISSDTAGPLGAIHLPRLWAKLTLGNAGLLADGYDSCGAGFDQMTIDGLGLNRDKVLEFIKSRRPTYMQFEEWVVEQNGGSIPREKIDKQFAVTTIPTTRARACGPHRESKTRTLRMPCA
jgi:hypothetical protein